MKFTIDTAARTCTLSEGAADEILPLYSRRAFEALSLQWVRVGWSLRYYHTFSWFGLPVLQLPEDLVRFQEVVYRLRPDVIIETGIFHGGSVLFHASLFQAIGRGRVIGIDLRIEPDTRERLTQHALSHRITLLEGDSTEHGIVDSVAAMIAPADTVLVVLDSDHSKKHVARELECYSKFVTPGSYIVATDGIMQDLADVPGGEPEWRSDNPAAAAEEFAALHPEFRLEQPAWRYPVEDVTVSVTYWPSAWLERLLP